MSDLRGYTLPLTPGGASSFVSPPPWHFDGNLLFVEFAVDPRVARRFLPPELADGDQVGRAAIVWADWQSASGPDAGRDCGDPCRSQFKEVYVVLACQHDGAFAARSAFAWVDQAYALVRGWIQGTPKKMAAIWVTRPTPLGRVGGRLAPGGTFMASASAHDRLLAEAEVVLRRPVERPPDLHFAPVVNTRVFPDLGPGTTAVHEPMVTTLVDQVHADVWEGDVTALRFHPVEGEELADLVPVEVGPAYFFSYAETLIVPEGG